MSGNTRNDFRDSLMSVIKVSEMLKCNIEPLINRIFSSVLKIINKIQSENYSSKFTTIHFFTSLEKGMGIFAGAMPRDEFFMLGKLSEENKLTIKHVRKCCNMLWCFVKYILTQLLFGFVSNGQNKISFDLYKQNYSYGIDQLRLFLREICDINYDLLQHLITFGIGFTEFNYGKECVEITEKLLYEHIIRLTYTECRTKSTKERNLQKCGYDEVQLSQASIVISKYLSDEEKTQVLPNKKYPWSGDSIHGIISNTYYENFCKNHDIHIGSGLSGTTFEIVMYMFAIFNFQSHDEIQGILAFVFNFHILRGTHSVMEVVLAFYEINKHLLNHYQFDFINLNKFLENVVSVDENGKKILKFTKSKLCEEFVLGNSDGNENNVLFYEL